MFSESDQSKWTPCDPLDLMIKLGDQKFVKLILTYKLAKFSDALSLLCNFDESFIRYLGKGNHETLFIFKSNCVYLYEIIFEKTFL